MAALKAASFRGELSAVSFLDSSRGPFVQHKGWIFFSLFRCLLVSRSVRELIFLLFRPDDALDFAVPCVLAILMLLLTPFRSISFHISGFHSKRFAMCVTDLPCVFLCVALQGLCAVLLFIVLLPTWRLCLVYHYRKHY